PTTAFSAYRGMASDPYFDGGTTSPSGGGSTGGGSTGGGSTGSGSTGTGSTGTGSSTGTTGTTGSGGHHHRFHLSAVSASPDTLVAWSAVSFALDRRALVSVRILDEQGRVIRHRLTRRPFAAGAWAVRWH